ncbi:MAG: beta-lactamase [Phenylobacterium sp.]|jgi:beta-lactamase class A|nr:beta-lactamase [Phenylobacterium sp.]MDB5436848.1 beta-lactamase [Phenylobacterium sp.]MDB5463327.1 beta-lactamase [Phenylobacterium sp.]
MKRFAGGLWRWARARPRTLAAAAVVLLAVGFAGGWVGAAHVATPKVAYTRGPPAPIPDKPAPAAPAEFQAALDHLANAYGEPVGIAVSDVAQGWTAEVAGRERFPQQSVSKLWVALAVLQAVDEGQLKLDQWVVMLPQDRSVFYQPLTSRIRGPNGLAITLSDLLRHALIESDNAANDRLIREVGGAGVVTRALAEKGLQGLAVGGTERDLQTRTAGLTWRPEYGVTWIFKQARAQLPDDVRDQALAAYLADPPDGATPLGIVTALAALKRGELLSRASTDFMLGLMGEARTGQLRLKAGLAPGWTLAHKTGTGPDWRGASVGINDVGLLTAPDGRTFAVAVMVRQTRQGPTARHRLMQGVARAVEAQWKAGDRAGEPPPTLSAAPVVAGGGR